MIFEAESYDLIRSQVSRYGTAVPPDQIADQLHPVVLAIHHIASIEGIESVPWLPRCNQTMSVIAMDNGERWIVKDTFDNLSILIRAIDEGRR